MPVKKYLVREGFVVVQSIKKSDGTTYDRTYTGGEEISLDEDQAAPHIHKLEFATAKDRDAALAAEKEANVARAAANSPAELVTMLVAALQASLGTAAPATPAA